MNQSRKKQASALFTPFERVRSSHRVAQAIMRVIVEGQIRPGETLPPERTLAERFRVTRNTVREALRALESLRLVTVRQGSGIEVRDYLHSAGLELIASLVESADADTASWILDVAEARDIIGSAMISHAVVAMDDESVPAVIAAIDDFEKEAAQDAPDMSSLQRLDFEIHSRIVRAAGNRALILLHNSIRHIYERVAPLFETLFENPVPVLALYREVARSLEDGNRTEAVEHFERYFQLGREAMLVLTTESEVEK